MSNNSSSSAGATTNANVSSDNFGRDLQSQDCSISMESSIIHMPPQNITDELVIEQIAGGDTKAMRIVVERFGALIWSIAKRYVRPEHFIEDLSQDILTEIWKKAASFNREKSSARTFIALITRRRCIDWLRKKNNEPVIESLDNSFDDQLQHDSSVGVTNETLKRAMKLLTEKEQELFQLHFQKGMTHVEIAESIGVPLGTIKTQLRRGIIKLRQTLTQAQ